MSEKWTPGPWRWAHAPWQTDLRNNSGRRIFASVSSTDFEWAPSGMPDEEAAANAHLIAAAPELYAALSCFLDDPRFQVGVGGNPNVVVAMISAARAALAKARGETVDG